MGITNVINTTAIGSNFKRTKLAKMNELEGRNDLMYKQLEMFQKSQGKRLCAMEPHLRLESLSTRAGIEPGTARSVGQRFID